MPARKAEFAKEIQFLEEEGFVKKKGRNHFGDFYKRFIIDDLYYYQLTFRMFKNENLVVYGSGSMHKKRDEKVGELDFSVTDTSSTDTLNYIKTRIILFKIYCELIVFMNKELSSYYIDNGIYNQVAYNNRIDRDFFIYYDAFNSLILIRLDSYSRNSLSVEYTIEKDNLDDCKQFILDKKLIWLFV